MVSRSFLLIFFVPQSLTLIVPSDSKQPSSGHLRLSSPRLSPISLWIYFVFFRLFPSLFSRSFLFLFPPPNLSPYTKLSSTAQHLLHMDNISSLPTHLHIHPPRRFASFPLTLSFGFLHSLPHVASRTSPCNLYRLMQTVSLNAIGLSRAKERERCCERKVCSRSLRTRTPTSEFRLFPILRNQNLFFSPRFGPEMSTDTYSHTFTWYDLCPSLPSTSEEGSSLFLM